MSPNEALKLAKEALAKALEEKKLSQEIIKSLGPAILEALTPSIQSISENSKITRDEFLDVISKIKINVPPTNVPEAKVTVEIPEIKVPQPIVNVSVPEIKIPEFKEIKLPTIKVPKPEVTVNFDATKIKFPEIKMPKEMDIAGWVSLMGYDKGFLSNPLPVQLRDAKGNPVNLGGSSTIMGGGGKMDYFTIRDIRASAISVIDQDIGAVRVVGNLTASLASSTVVTLINNDGLAYNGDNPLPVTFSAASIQPVSQVSGHAWSVAVIEIFGSTAADVVNPDGRLKVELPTGASGLTDTELRASSVPVSQVSGSIWSVSAIQATSPWVISATDLDIRDLNVTQDEILVHQVSGSIWSTSVTNTVTVTGALTSSVAVGPTPADTADDGNAPVQIGGIARTANPTAVAGNDVVKATYDDLGRQVVRELQVRDLLKTAYATLTNGTETALSAGIASTFQDLVYIMGSNSSDAAVLVDIRDATAGGIVMTLGIPANGTAGVSLQGTPIPQNLVATAWTADMGDVTGTTVYLSALFSQEI